VHLKGEPELLITLSSEELEKCREFSYECAKNQQQIEFGQSDTAARGVTEIGRDNLIGKVAEVAFSKMMMEKYDIPVHLDFSYYPRGLWDAQDATINGWRIDVKGTRKGGKWLLVEWSKLNFRKKEGKLSHLYVMASVMWNRTDETPARQVDIVGCASLRKLLPNVPTTKVLRKGDFIPNTKTRLQADNYAIHFSDLFKDWNAVVGEITSNKPFAASDYPNPYSIE